MLLLCYSSLWAVSQPGKAELLSLADIEHVCMTAVVKRVCLLINFTFYTNTANNRNVNAVCRLCAFDNDL